VVITLNGCALLKSMTARRAKKMKRCIVVGFVAMNQMLRLKNNQMLTK
jgi:hypothetical protein